MVEPTPDELTDALRKLSAAGFGVVYLADLNEAKRERNEARGALTQALADLADLDERYETKSEELSDAVVAIAEVANQRNFARRMLRGMAARASHFRRQFVETARLFEQVQSQAADDRIELSGIRDAAVMLPPDWVVQVEKLNLDNHPTPDQAVIDLLISWGRSSESAARQDIDEEQHGCRCYLNPPCSHCTDCTDCAEEADRA